MELLLYRPKHSLIDQSLHARLGPHTTNGDGFGVGWYGDGDMPALYKSAEPIWNDRNLREISRQVAARLMFAHIRASTGTPVQQTNCHPFRHGNWLWMHNGQIAGFQTVKRELVLAVDPNLYPSIEGSSDTEIFFYLALTFGLEQDPRSGVDRAVGFIERVCRQHDIEHPMRMSLAVSDGRDIWAFRYSSDAEPPSLFYSTEVETLREQHPEIEALRSLSKETRLVVSEPLGELAGAWIEMPASTCGLIQRGQDKLHPFKPAFD